MANDAGGSEMTTAASKTAQAKGPNLSREGAALQRSVSGELNWVRESIKGGRTRADEILGIVESPVRPKNSKKQTKKK